ncbi:MAG: YncE family protein [Gaiellaceae bacterium]
MRFALVLPAVLVLVAFARGAAADGGGRAEAVAYGSGRVWTTVRDRVVAVDPVTGRTLGGLGTGVFGNAIVVANGTLWRLQPHELVGIRVSTGRVRARVGLGQASYALAATANAVWTASFDSDTLTKAEARSGRRVLRVRVPHWPMAIAAGSRAIWVASIGRAHSVRGGVIVPDGRGVLARVDAASGAVRARILVGRGPRALALDGDTVWVLEGRGVGARGQVDRVDVPRGRVMSSVKVPHWPEALAVGRRYVWVVSSPRSAGGVLTRIDKRTLRTVTQRIAGSWVPAAVTLAGGGVWAADPGVAALIRINPHTLAITKRVTFPVG